MAKNTQEAEVIVTMNGEAAKKTIAEVTAKMKELQKASMDAYKSGNDALGKKLDAEAQKLMKDITITKNETKKFADVMKNINGASLKQLNDAARRLRQEINKLAPGTKEFIEKSKQLQEVNTRVKQLQNSFRGVVEEQKRAFSFKSLSEGFNRYFGLISTAIASITGLSMAFRKAAQDAAAMDDAYSQVMKTTSLTKEQVKALNEEFKKMDTRTSREELNRMAYEAGKLGFNTVEAVQQFVEAADIINVALGDVLGEGATLEIAKLAQVFSQTTEVLQQRDLKGKMLAVGSAVNQLGKESTASESYMVEFLGRLGGVATQAGLSADQILGYASALDQMKQKVEMSATAFQKLIQQMIKKPEEFVEAAKMPLEEFQKMMETDMNGAIQRVLTGFNEMGGFTQLIPIFKDMGLDGARAAGVISSLASNLDKVSAAQATANEHIRLGTSMTREYEIMNSSMQARLEKARKSFKDASIALGESLNPVMLKTTKATTYLIKALVAYGKEIKTVAITLAAYTVAVKAASIAQGIFNGLIKAGKTLKATYTVVVKALEYAYARLTGKIVTATKAYIAMNAAMSASVFGVIAAAVVGLTLAISNYVKKQREAAEAADWVARAERKAKEEYTDQIGRVKALTAVVQNNNVALEDRRRALEELKAIVPQYHADLTEEGRLINSNTTAVEEYCRALRKQIRLQAYNDELVDVEKQIAAIEERKEQLEQERQEALLRANGDTTESRTVTFKDEMDYGVEKSYQQLTEYGAVVSKLAHLQADELNPLLEREAAIMAKIGDISGQNAKASMINLEAMEKEIIGTQSKYDELIDQLDVTYRNDPKKAEKERKRLEEERDRELAAIRAKYTAATQTSVEGEAELNTILTEDQFNYLQERYSSLTKKEQGMIDAGYQALGEEESKALAKRYTKLMATDSKAADQRYNAAIAAIETRVRGEQNAAKHEFLNGEITYGDYVKRLEKIQRDGIQAKLELAKQEGRDTTAIEQQMLDDLIRQRKAGYDEEVKQLDTNRAETENALKISLASQEMTEQEYQRQMLTTKMNYLEKKLQLARDYGQDETAIMQSFLDAQLEAQKLTSQEMAKLKEAAKDVRAELDPQTAIDSEMMQKLAQLDTLHEAMLLSEEEYEKAVKSLRKKYSEESLKERLSNVTKFTEKANELFNEASNFVVQLKEAESQKLEAQYQADLTSAGDNAEKREQVEAEYEQKKLDLSKKYADTEMVINIAKTIAAGALAAIQAFAQLGPIAGGIAAGLIAATTAAEVAVIIAQRNAIKNSSVSNSGTSSASGGATVQRVMTGGGYAKGGFTEDQTTVTTVGEKGTEWIAPHWMVKQEPVVFANLERYRLAGTHGRSGSVARGFADGGYTGTKPQPAASAQVSDKDILSAIREGAYLGVKEALAGERIKAYILRHELSELDAQDARLKSQTSRG